MDAPRAACTGGFGRGAGLSSMRFLAQLAVTKIVGPTESQVDDRPGRMIPRGLAQAALDHLALRRLVARRAKRQSEGMPDEAGERGFDEGRDLRHLRDGDGR